jgi:hypothetical protein
MRYCNGRIEKMRNNWYKKSLVVGIIVLLVGISIMPLVSSLSIEKYVSIAIPYGIDLSCDEPYKNVKQGDTAMFIVEITNTGTLDDTYDVIAGSIEDIICKVNGINADQFNPYEFTLMSGESTTFDVTAEVWESVPIGEWSVIIEARSQNNTEVYDELTLTANVQKKTRVISGSKDDCNCNDEFNDNDKSERLICGFLQILIAYFLKFSEHFDELAGNYPPYPPYSYLHNIFIRLSEIMEGRAGAIVDFGVSIDCWDYPYP